MVENIREQLRQLLLEKSVRTGEFTLASGKKSDLYVDCRVTSFDARGARLIGESGWALVRDHLTGKGLSAAAIGGMTLGADPISLAIGMESARQQPDRFLQVFTVRKEAKEYGAGRRIEGNFSSGDPVVVVDDVVTTGGSTLRAIDAIEAEARDCYRRYSNVASDVVAFVQERWAALMGQEDAGEGPAYELLDGGNSPDGL